MKLRIKFADQIVGLFILVALVLFAVIIILIGANQRWFAKDYYYRTRFSSAAGVSPGTSILMKGFTVGKIQSIALNDENNVDARFSIYDTYIHLVREYSLLELTVSPIGLGSQLLFHPGLSEKPLEEETFIPTADSEEGAAYIELGLVAIPPKDDTITRLLAAANPLIEHIDRTVVALQKTLEGVNDALAGDTGGPLGGILVDVKGTTASLPAMIDGIERTVEEVSELTVDVLAEVDSAVADAATLIADIRREISTLLEPKGSIKTFLDDDNEIYRRVTGIASGVETAVADAATAIASIGEVAPAVTALLDEVKSTVAGIDMILADAGSTIAEVSSAIAGTSAGPLGEIVAAAAATTARLPETIDGVNATMADLREEVTTAVASVVALVDGITADINDLLESIAAVGGNVDEITGNLAATTAELRDPTGLVTKLLDPHGSLATLLDDDNALYERIAAIAASAEASVVSLSRIVAGLDSEVPKISAVLNETRNAVREAQDVLEGVRNNPLIRGGIPEMEPPQPLQRSLREGSFE